MKRFLNASALFVVAALACSCSDDTFSSLNAPEGIPVELSLGIKDVSPQKTNVDTRATELDEKHLYNLQIFIFDKDKKLKGYKMLGEGELNQNGEEGSCKIKTKTGRSYIYAVANADPTGLSLYNVPGMRSDITEDAAQQGNVDFGYDNLSALRFTRSEGGIDITDGRFVMFGSANEGNQVVVAGNEGGEAKIINPSDPDAQLIKLRRVVSRNNFKVSTADGESSVDGKYKKRSFIITGVELVSVPKSGNLEKGDLESDANNFETLKLQLSTQDKDENGNYNFTVYLPENLQVAKKHVALGKYTSRWAAREEDSGVGDGKRVFTYAPDNATAIVLHGQYTEQNKDGSGQRFAIVDYTIHLGDMSTDLSDFSVKRNYDYTYNIKVMGVNNIKVEVETSQSPQPGAEGLVMDYEEAKPFSLDSHYDFCVMRFSQKDIQNAIASPLGGYIYKVETINGESDPIVVKGDGSTEGSLNGVDDNWVSFMEGGQYGDANSGRGKPEDYAKFKTEGKKLYSIKELLTLLYSKAGDDAWWDGAGKTKTYTCFVDENYYKDRAWNEFTNKDPRILLIANRIDNSVDERSYYAKVAYSISQKSIQTFYNADKANELVAYGVESVSEDKNLKKTNKDTDGAEGEDFDGRSNMLKVYTSPEAWFDYEANSSFRKACISRNRDLDGSGKIEEDEVRWYTPSAEQYGGLWIGEEALNTDARLFTGDLSNVADYFNKPKGRMHYYTSSKGNEVFWAEEGMAVGAYGDTNALEYARCVRTLKSYDNGDTGYGLKPETFYDASSDTNLVNLEKLDKTSLRNNVQTGELVEHSERQPANRPFRKFRVAKSVVKKDGMTYTDVVSGKVNCSSYTEGGLKGWRVPNQRELALIWMNNINDESFAVSSCKTHFGKQKYNGVEKPCWVITKVGNTTRIRMFTKEDNFGLDIRCVRDEE